MPIETLLLKLKLQYFGHLMWRANCLEKTLMLGKIEGKRRRWQQRMRWLDSITNTMDMNLSKLQEIVEDRRAWRAVVHGVTDSWTWVNNWTTTRVLNWGKFHKVCSRFLLESSHLWREGCFFLLGIGRASLTQGSYNLLQSKVRVFPVPTTSYIPLA